MNNWDLLGLEDRNHFAVGSDIYNRAAQQPDAADLIDIHGHGRDNGNKFEDEQRKGNPYLDEKKVAESVDKARERKQGGTCVKLWACETGKGSNTLAQRLANELGIPVIAPTELIWYPSNGTVCVIAKPDPSDSNRPSKAPADQGSWKTFFPAGTSASDFPLPAGGFPR